jgi:ATP-binding cassette, subfamily B, bacterial MsbA
MRFTVAGAVTEWSKKLTHCFPVSLVCVSKHAWSTLLEARVYQGACNNLCMTSDFQRYKRLLRYAKPYRGRLIAGMLMLALVSLIEPVITIAFSQILDRAFVPEMTATTAIQGVLPASSTAVMPMQSALMQSALFAGLSGWLRNMPIMWFPFLLVLIFALRGATNFLGDLALHWVSSRVVFDLRQITFAHLLRLPVSFFDRNAAAELTSKITFDTQQIGAVTSQALTTLVQDSLKLIVALVMMAAISWKLTLGVFVIAPVVAVVVRLLTKRQLAHLQSQMGELSRFTDEGLSNQRSIKIYGAFAQISKAFAERANRVRRTIMKQETANAASAPLMHLVVSVAIAGIVALAISEGQRRAMTAGDFFIFFTALLSLLPPLKSLSAINSVLQRGLAAATSLFAVLDEPAEPALVASGERALNGAVKFEAVTARYAGRDADALVDVSFEIAAGRHVAFVGASGSGKSTAIALLAGFYKPQRGEITIDGQGLKSIGLQTLRDNISLVAQDVLLINDSVAANIAFGGADGKSDQSRVLWAAQAAGAATFIDTLPGGFAAMVGEGGSLLSGGQRQRISIARALYKGAPIVLFDEATSALDSESERLVHDTLEILGPSHTVIQVAHRLSTIRNVCWRDRRIEVAHPALKLQPHIFRRWLIQPVV